MSVETACMIGVGVLLGSAALALILAVALEPLRVEMRRKCHLNQPYVGEAAK